MSENNENGLPPEAASRSSDGLGAVQDDLYFALRERDLWMKQCLDAEAKVSAYEDVFTNCMPVNKEFKSNYSPSMIRLRWQLDQPTELDRAVRGAPPKREPKPKRRDNDGTSTTV